MTVNDAIDVILVAPPQDFYFGGEGCRRRTAPDVRDRSRKNFENGQKLGVNAFFTMEAPLLPRRPDEEGSSIGACTFNFSNSIIGAGCIGLGGAMAQSGGLVSCLTIVVFAWLFKLSLDLLIELSLDFQVETYEGLAFLALGKRGRSGVIASKMLYSFGCLIAYVVVCKDNLGPAIKSLIFGDGDDSESPGSLGKFLDDGALVTWSIGALVVLPLCLLRDMKPLSMFSVVSIVSMIVIVGIVTYLYFVPSPPIRQEGGTLYDRWFQTHPAYLSCLGTFVFTYASQHIVHMAFHSLKPELRTLENWKAISTCSIGLAATVSLSIGVMVYVTFWDSAQSDIFNMYPSILIVNIAKLLLCVTLLLTFPLPFTCRELFLLLFTTTTCGFSEDDEDQDELMLRITPSTHDNPEDPLIELECCSLEEADGDRRTHVRMSSFHHDAYQPILDDLSETASEDEVVSRDNWKSHFFIPHRKLQLKLLYHVIVTTIFWFTVMVLAIAAPNLGDVLDVVGCASGTMIAFFYPGAIAYKLRGYSWKVALIFGAGIVIFPVGTYYSLKKLIDDLRS